MMAATVMKIMTALVAPTSIWSRLECYEGRGQLGRVTGPLPR